MTETTAFKNVKRWTGAGFGRLLFLLLLETVLLIGAVKLFTGFFGESERGAASSSSEDQPLQQHFYTTDSPLMPPQTQHDANITENLVSRRRRSSEDSVLPPTFLTASHLSALRDLVSDKKITVRLGLRVSLSGPSELLDPQQLLSLYREPGLYNIGGKAGLFSMRIVGIKRVASAPRFHHPESTDPTISLIMY